MFSRYAGLQYLKILTHILNDILLNHNVTRNKYTLYFPIAIG